MQDKILGYDYNDGGITNQKLCLLGLVCTAHQLTVEQPIKIYLPRVTSYDQHKTNSFQENFENVFWVDIFRDFARRWKIEIQDRPSHENFTDYQKRHGWDYFGTGASCVGRLRHLREIAGVDIGADFFRSLIPQVASSTTFQMFCNEIFTKRNITTVVQLRIEEDWFHYCKTMIEPTLSEAEDVYLSAESILEKLKFSIPNAGDTVFVVCDERYIFAPKDDIKRAILEKTGIQTVWKSDLIRAEEFNEMSPLITSLMDFELALRAKLFVGNSRSTFSNQVSFERFCRSGYMESNDYIYNMFGPNLGKRSDFGTQITPTEVTRIV